MLKAFFPDIGNKTRTSPITASIQHYTQDTHWSKRVRKKNYNFKDGKGRNKPPYIFR